MGTFEELDRLGHQARANPATIAGRMDGDAHQISIFAVQRVKLVTHDPTIQFGHDKVGMGVHDVGKREGIVAPEMLKAELLQLKQDGHIAHFDAAQTHSLIAPRGDLVIKLIIGVELAERRKAACQQWAAQPVVLQIISRIMQVAHPTFY